MRVGANARDVVRLGRVEPGKANGEIRRRITAELERLRAAARHRDLEHAAFGSDDTPTEEEARVAQMNGVAVRLEPPEDGVIQRAPEMGHFVVRESGHGNLRSVRRARV